MESLAQKTASAVKVNGAMTVPSADGGVKHVEIHTTLDKMPDQLTNSESELRRATAEMVKVLTEVPPPGKVTLADLGLPKHQGNPEMDFLMSAKDEDGKPIPFEYVRLGVPSYDNFFKQVQVVYATCYQGRQTARRLVELTSGVLNEKVEATAELNASVSKALQREGQAGVDGSLVGKLKGTVELGGSLSTLVAQLVGQIATLVTTGEALVTGAPTSLTNPKVVAHLDLVKKGLVDSIAVVKAAPDLMAMLKDTLGGVGALSGKSG